MTPGDGAVLLPEPKIEEETEPFWASIAAGQLSLCRCTTCQTWLHPPVPACRRCGGATQFEPVGGSARVYTFIVSHRPATAAFAALGAYPIALVEPDDAPGVRLPAMIIDRSADSVATVPVAVESRGRLVIGPHPLDGEPTLLFEPEVGP